MNSLTSIRSILSRSVSSPSFVSLRCLTRWPIPPTFSSIEMPELEQRKLPMLDAVPVLMAGQKSIKYDKGLYDLRGPEPIHNQLMYGQFGIISLSGGQLKASHLNNIRTTVNKYLDTSKMFAVWRVDPPWKGKTKKGQGKRMGGGRGNISFYITPVRAGRIILEVGGTCELEEVLFFLHAVAQRMPFDASVISKESMVQLEKELEKKNKENCNPINLKRLFQNNILDAQNMCSPYDQMWYGKYI